MSNYDPYYNHDSSYDKWDILRTVEFDEKKALINQAKAKIKIEIREIGKICTDEQLNENVLMMLILSRFHSLLRSFDLSHVYDDYDFWIQAMEPLKPVFAGYWAECDPMLISYLYMIFISQFMVVLKLWELKNFDKEVIEDCARIGEFYLVGNPVQNGVIMSLLERWGKVQSSGNENGNQNRP